MTKAQGIVRENVRKCRKSRLFWRFGLKKT